MYCPVCKGFSGETAVKSEVALSCGYELSIQDGDDAEYRYNAIKETIKKDAIAHQSCGKDTLRIGKKTREGFYNPDTGAQNPSFVRYELYCNGCDVEIRSISGFCIDKFEFDSNPFFPILRENIKELESIYISHIPKIPRPLFCDYQDYINSDNWQRKRNERLALDRKQCVLCFSLTNLHVHHVTYERLFKEKMSDLMTVCKSCHEVIHNRNFEGE